MKTPREPLGERIRRKQHAATHRAALAARRAKPPRSISLAIAAKRSRSDVYALTPADLDTLAAHPVSVWEAFRALLDARQHLGRVRVGDVTMYALEKAERKRVRTTKRVLLVDGAHCVVPREQGGRLLTPGECASQVEHPHPAIDPVAVDTHGSKLKGAGYYVVKGSSYYRPV